GEALRADGALARGRRGLGPEPRRRPRVCRRRDGGGTRLPASPRPSARRGRPLPHRPPPGPAALRRALPARHGAPRRRAPGRSTHRVGPVRPARGSVARRDDARVGAGGAPGGGAMTGLAIPATFARERAAGTSMTRRRAGLLALWAL